MAVVLLSESLPRQMSMARSIVWPLPLELLDGVVGGARRGEKYNTPDILIRLKPFVISDSVKRRGVGAAQSK